MSHIHDQFYYQKLSYWLWHFNPFGMEAVLMRRQLRWCWHIFRMEGHHLPKVILYLEMSKGKRKHGGQHLNACALIPQVGRCSLHIGRLGVLHHTSYVYRNVKTLEQTRFETLDVKRQIRKKDKPSLAPALSHVVPRCNQCTGTL